MEFQKMKERLIKISDSKTDEERLAIRKARSEKFTDEMFEATLKRDEREWERERKRRLALPEWKLKRQFRTLKGSLVISLGSFENYKRYLRDELETDEEGNLIDSKTKEIIRTRRNDMFFF